MRLYFDFDRTLFDTDRFGHDYVEAMVQAVGEQAHGLSDKEAARSLVDDLTLYDFHAHLDELGIDKKVAHDILAGLDLEQYLYEDTLELLAELKGRPELMTEILTFGHQQYQRLKLEPIAPISHLPHNIVQRAKRHFLSEINEPAILVDDLTGLQLPPPHQEFTIDRTAKQHQRINDQRVVITRLPELFHYL